MSVSNEINEDLVNIWHNNFNNNEAQHCSFQISIVQNLRQYTVNDASDELLNTVLARSIAEQHDQMGRKGFLDTLY